MDEGHEHRLEGEVGPRRVERRGPHQHPPGPDTALEERRLPIVETRERGAARTGCDAAKAIEASRREIARSRPAEHLEERMTGTRARRGAPRRRGIRSTAAPGTPGRMSATDGQVARSPAMTNNPPPRWTNRLQPLRRRLRDRRVVEDHDRRRRDVLARERVGLTGLGVDAGRLADRHGAGQIQARVPARSRPLAAMTTSTGSSGDTTKWNTLSRASASSARRTVARTLRSATVTGSNVVDADPRAATLTRRDWIARPPISSVISTFAAAHVGVIDGAGRHRDPLLILELRLLQRDRRDREVGSCPCR